MATHDIVSVVMRSLLLCEMANADDIRLTVGNIFVLLWDDSYSCPTPPLQHGSVRL